MEKKNQREGEHCLMLLVPCSKCPYTLKLSQVKARDPECSFCPSPGWEEAKSSS